MDASVKSLLTGGFDVVWWSSYFGHADRFVLCRLTLFKNVGRLVV